VDENEKNERSNFMGLFTRLFKKSEHHQEITKISSEKHDDDEYETKWKVVPAYIEASTEDYQLVSLIATAIAAGDQPKSQFVVKKVMQRNPEAKLVSIIAASLAAGINAQSQFVVQKIHKNRNLEGK
jgi:hypothetical protein